MKKFFILSISLTTLSLSACGPYQLSEGEDE